MAEPLYQLEESRGFDNSMKVRVVGEEGNQLCPFLDIGNQGRNDSGMAVSTDLERHATEQMTSNIDIFNSYSDTNYDSSSMVRSSIKLS